MGQTMHRPNPFLVGHAFQIHKVLLLRLCQSILRTYVLYYAEIFFSVEG